MNWGALTPSSAPSELQDRLQDGDPIHQFSCPMTMIATTTVPRDSTILPPTDGTWLRMQMHFASFSFTMHVAIVLSQNNLLQFASL
eukprot:scaffold191_cov273-Chaetoceros_neogracile.AAC.15